MTQTSDDAKKSYLTISEAVQVYQVLSRVLHPGPEDGTWVYDNGATDETVLGSVKTIIPKATLRNVISVRKQCFGELYKDTKSVERAVGDRLNAIEKNIVIIFRKLDQLETELINAHYRMDKINWSASVEEAVECLQGRIQDDENN